jgi:predicted acetyltransferase
MPELVAPNARLQAAWLGAHQEWGSGAHEDGFGLLPSDDVGSPAGFATWLARLEGASERCTYRWIVEDGQVLGGIALRHELDEVLLREGGHIGYGIRPSARRRGLASWALGQMLGVAATVGLHQVLIVCKVDNVGSARTIERNGGVLEDIRQTKWGAMARYWITVEDRPPAPATPA